jgi:XTP/dITP diphosphohydrolase
VRLTLLATSSRVAAGLLTRAAWHEVESADRVVTADAGTAAALRAQGVEVEEVADLATFRARPGDGDVAILVDRSDLDVAEWPEGTSSVVAAYDLPGARLLDLVTVMDRLRSECPWDREQTHRSLARYLLEEAYETLEAIESGDVAHLREELGDLLLQVYFHARIASETDEGFDIDDVAGDITDKLVFRHPHVFAGLEVADADEVDRNWERLKAEEKQRSSPLDGIPVGLPALAYADKVLGRLTKAGLVGDQPPGPSLGDRLLGLVAEARRAGADPEQELRDSVRRLISGAGVPGRPPGRPGLG